MTRQIVSACGALALGAVMASAQTPQSPTRAQASDSANAVTITGCLKVWDEALGMSRTDIASPQAAPAGARQFVLTAARSGGQGTYILDVANAGANLRAHVNHTVEVTGVVRAEPGSSNAQSSAESGNDMLATLTVTAVKMVSADCR